MRYTLAAEKQGRTAPRALFMLHNIDRLEFRSSSLTICNRKENSASSPTPAVFFEFPEIESEPLAPRSQLATINSTPTIWIERCVARGQATLVRAVRAVPFLLFWDQGLFVSTQRLVEMGGTMVQPRWEHGRATLFFQRLLAAADQGICRIKTDGNAPYSLGLTANCYDCLFVTTSDRTDVPLYEIQTTTTPADDSILLSVGGNNNYYKHTQVVLRLDSTTPLDRPQTFTFEDLKKQEEVAWYHEKDPQPGVMFRWEPRRTPVDRQSFGDFRPASEPNGTLDRILRISPEQLPHPIDDRLPAT